mgnify:CR=1 FL=1
MDISVPSAENNFNPELLVRLLAEVLEPHLEEFYPTILGKVFGDRNRSCRKSKLRGALWQTLRMRKVQFLKSF